LKKQFEGLQTSKGKKVYNLHPILESGIDHANRALDQARMVRGRQRNAFVPYPQQQQHTPLRILSPGRILSSPIITVIRVTILAANHRKEQATLGARPEGAARSNSEAEAPFQAQTY
jgi:hypothetical protein